FPRIRDLVAWLGAPDLESRRRAARTLGKYYCGEQVPEVVALEKDPDLSFRTSASGYLTRIGPAMIPVREVVELLQDRDLDIRRGAAWALGWAGLAATSAVPALGSLLRDPNVCSAAFEALAEIGLEAVPELAKALKDPEMKVRISAVQALESI